MAGNSENIIKQFAENLEKDIKAAIPVATGSTRDSVHTVFRSKKGFDIFVGSQINQIINGRGPTKPGAKKGNPTLQQMMLEYIKAKSIRPREAGMTELQLSWAFAMSIHKKGFKGRGNIFANIITKTRIDSFTNVLLKDRIAVIQSDVIKNIQFK